MKSYAGVYLEEGRLSILYDYDGIKNKVSEHSVTKIRSRNDMYMFESLLNDVKSKLDDTLINICICIPPELEAEKALLNYKVYRAELKRFQVVEKYKVESLKLIVEAGYNLKSDAIIGLYLNGFQCIWHGKNCKITFENENFQYLLITNEFSLNTFIYEKESEKQLDKNFIKQLHPNCELVEYKKQQNNTNPALIYAQKMFKRDDPALSKNSTENVLECQRNTNFPVTYIYVGVNYYSETTTYFFGSFSFKGMQKEFSFEVEDINSSDLKWKEIKKKLKIAEIRLNGILGSICFRTILINSIEFLIKWAKQCGFKKVEVIDSRKEDYHKILQQLRVTFKYTDITWIDFGKVFDIWENGLFQRSIWFDEIETSDIKHPNYILYEKCDSSESQINQNNEKAKLQKMFPDCRFLMFETLDIPKKAALKHALTMSNVTYLIQANPKFEMTPLINTSIKGSLKGKGTITTTPVAQMNFPFPRKVVIDNISIKVIGIDLGTSRCCAAVNRKNGISTVQLDNSGERLLPSYVAYDEKIVKCGKVVVNRLRNYAKSTVFDSKRIIGRSLNDVEIDSNWPFRISENENKVVMELKKCGIEVQISAEEVAADLLKHIKQKSEDFQGTKMTDVVITIPAAFTEAQKTATIEAAKLAGWEKIELLHEPIAAAFAYFIEKHIPHKSNVLVFDLGGGTLDVCIFKIENNQILILSNTGDTKLGGRDFDTVLFNYFLNQLGTKHDISLIKDKKYKLILDCQRIKEDLSAVANCVLNVDEYEPNMHEIIDISRNEFQSLTKPLLNRIKNTIHSALHESKFDKKEIEKILLVGGGSRMPMIKTLLKEIFPRAEQCCAEHPDEVVAIGAAYYAYSHLSQ